MEGVVQQQQQVPGQLPGAAPQQVPQQQSMQMVSSCVWIACQSRLALRKLTVPHADTLV